MHPSPVLLCIIRGRAGSVGGSSWLGGGSGGDILIAGTTLYDRNVIALNALLATWANTTLTPDARVAALRSGVSYPNGIGTHQALLVTGPTNPTVSQTAGSGHYVMGD